MQLSQASSGNRRPRAGVVLAAAAAAAAGLAATAVFNGWRARRAERRNPPAGRFMEVDGIRLHYREKGSGPPLVLLHGNLVSGGDFAASGLFERLAEDYRVIAFDRPGLGYSARPRGRRWTPSAQAALLARAFAALGAGRPVVLGHSMGAVVAMALALDHPRAVRGLVLLGGYFHPTARMDVPLVLPSALPVLGDVLCHTLSPLAGAALMPAFVKAMFAPSPVPERFSRGFSAEMAVRPGQMRAMARDAAAMVPAAAAMRGGYRELRIPLALVAGSDDRVVDTGRQSARLHREVPQASLRLVPGAGHMIHYAAPDEVLAAVAEVMARAAGHGRPGPDGISRVRAATKNGAPDQESAASAAKADPFGSAAMA